MTGGEGGCAANHWCMLEMLCEERILGLYGHDEGLCGGITVSSGALG